MIIITVVPGILTNVIGITSRRYFNSGPDFNVSPIYVETIWQRIGVRWWDSGRGSSRSSSRGSSCSGGSRWRNANLLRFEIQSSEFCCKSLMSQ